MAYPASPSSLAMVRANFIPTRDALRADDRHWRQPENFGIALDGDQRRRVGGLPQTAGIVRFADAKENSTHFCRGVHFPFGVFQACNANRTSAAAAPDELRQHFQRVCRRTAMGDQIAKCCRTDILAADQPEPAQPLAVRKAYAFLLVVHPLAPILPSAPDRRRPIFARCLMKTMIVRTRKSAAI